MINNEIKKSEVLKQAGQDFDLSDSGVVMRRLKSAVPQTGGSTTSAPQKAPTDSGAPSAGPTATSVAAPPAKPAGGVMSGRVYPRVEFCVGKNAGNNQAAWNINALKVWDVVAGQTEADAVEWDWVARRAELQQFAYQAS